jgi:putative peptide-modifying radical SAM enzyme
LSITAEGEEIFFHVILTTECNSHCSYCYGEALKDVDSGFSDFRLDYSLPKRIDYEVGVLDKFCRQDHDCTLTFYGGEPLLCINEIEQIVNNVKVKNFMIQTNGLLLNLLPLNCVNRLHTILVSIDGDETLTDRYRGKGTFKRVVENLKLIRQNGFRGELIARMTVMEHTDIVKQVKWLLDNEEFPFSSVHWQLNAGFWEKDFAARDFKRWSENSYNPGICSLVKSWVRKMEEDNVVLRLYPFLGIAHSLLFNEGDNNMRCGAGWINYAIQTDGNIIPCPTMWGMKDYYLGHISTANPMKLSKISIDRPCTECDALSLCGGRCLYANITKRWSNEAYAYVCSTVRALLHAVSEQIPRIQELIEEGSVELKDFEYMKYNGCEIIP